MMNIDQILKQAEAQKLQTQKFFDKLKKEKPSDLDQQFHQLHDKVFQKINCLDCANCCKTTGPLFTKRDIKVISKYFKMSETDFIAKYLRVDEDNDYVLQQVPCVFLAADNTCSIYAYRPNACREYPHTNQAKMHTILNETEKNVLICPAVYEITYRLRNKMK